MTIKEIALHCQRRAKTKEQQQAIRYILQMPYNIRLRECMVNEVLDLYKELKENEDKCK